MDISIASNRSDLGPIAPDWTITDLIHWLSDDARQHDQALQHPLVRIESQLTATEWSGMPSTVALIRSITDAARRDPALRSIRIRELGRHKTPRIPQRMPQLA